MKNLLSIKLLLLFIFSMTTLTSYSQTDWKEKLTKNIVKIENGKYSVEEYMLVAIDEETSVQFKTSAIAPIDVISRDNFVSIYSTYGIIMLIAILDEGGLDLSDLNIKELDELIGQPDIAIHFEMTKNGIQIQITTDEGTARQTMTWDDIFKQK
mgnify:CR=1 FL=1